MLSGPVVAGDFDAVESRLALSAGRRPRSRNGRAPPSRAGQRGELRAMIVIYIFGENHRFSEKTPHPGTLNSTSRGDGVTPDRVTTAYDGEHDQR
jgi:hypothetical protein